MVEYVQGFIRDSINDLDPMMQDYGEEVGPYYPGSEFEPDYEGYLSLEDHGLIKLFLVKSDEKVVGFCTVMVTNHLHCKGHAFAMVDCLYIKPEFRNYRDSLGLIRFVEDCLKQDGAVYFSIGTSMKKDIGSFLKLTGYSESSRYYGKVL